jgi:hypothetical protein
MCYLVGFVRISLQYHDRPQIFIVLCIVYFYTTWTNQKQKNYRNERVQIIETKIDGKRTNKNLSQRRSNAINTSENDVKCRIGQHSVFNQHIAHVCPSNPSKTVGHGPSRSPQSYS